MSRILLIEADEYNDLAIPGIEKNTPLDIVQPIGLLLLAAVARKAKPDRVIKILDTRLYKLDYSSMPEDIKSFNPDIVGIRTVSRAASFVYKLTEEIKKVCPDAIIIIGGPYVSASKGGVLEDKNIEIGVHGEADLTFSNLLERLEDKKPYDDINGVIYRDSDGNVQVNPAEPFVEDLDSLPFPAWDLIDMDTYFENIYNPHSPIYFNARREIASIFTSRGCPYNCTFCHNIFGKKMRFQSPAKVFSEMKRLYNEYGIRQFDIRDDIFNVNKKRAHEICDLIIESGLDISLNFPNGLRGDIMDEELILKLKKAGTFFITYALETGSPRIQKMIRKNIVLDRLKEAIDFTSEQGIVVRVFVMLGFPSETKEEMLMTRDFVMNPNIDAAVFHVVNPFEGTDIYHQVEEDGLDPSAFKDKYNYIAPNFSATSELSDEEFKDLYSEIVAGFFMDGKRVANAYQKWMTYHKKPGTY